MAFRCRLGDSLDVITENITVILRAYIPLPHFFLEVVLAKFYYHVHISSASSAFIPWRTEQEGNLVTDRNTSTKDMWQAIQDVTGYKTIMCVRLCRWNSWFQVISLALY